jgi:hypothetical protein
MTAEYIDTGEVFKIGEVEGKIVKTIVKDWYPSYFGTFFYHPYNQVCMGCCQSCGIQRIRERRQRRRKLKYEEQHYVKHWKDEINERDCLQEETG